MLLPSSLHLLRVCFFTIPLLVYFSISVNKYSLLISFKVMLYLLRSPLFGINFWAEDVELS